MGNKAMREQISKEEYGSEDTIISPKLNKDTEEAIRKFTELFIQQMSRLQKDEDYNSMKRYCCNSLCRISLYSLTS